MEPSIPPSKDNGESPGVEDVLLREFEENIQHKVADVRKPSNMDVVTCVVFSGLLSLGRALRL